MNKKEVDKMLKEMEQESVEDAKKAIENNEPADLGMAFGPIGSKKTIEFYCHDFPGSAFWNGVVEGLRQKGLSYDDIVETLKNKIIRRYLDDDVILDMVYEVGKHLAKEIELKDIY